MSDIRIAIDEKGTGRDTVTITDANVITAFNNFSGNFAYGGPSTEKRSVSVMIDDENAIQYFEQHGWNVKTTMDGERYLQIHVSYRFYNPDSANPVPTIIKRDPDTGTIVHLNEQTVGQLDDYRRKDGFEHCDLIFRGSPYETPMNGKGVSGYLQWMQVTPHYNAIEETISRIQYSNDGEDMPY